MNRRRQGPPQATRHLFWPLLALIFVLAVPAPLGLVISALMVAARGAHWFLRRSAAGRGGAAVIDPLGSVTLGRDPGGATVSVSRHALSMHALILGATGAGKTTTLMRLLQDRIARGEPVVVIDLKGSFSLRSDLQAAALAAGRSFTLWTPDGGSHWNPLQNGNATELKDKLLATERFTEPHYRRAAERYLQLAIQTAQEDSPGEPATLARIVDLLSPERLAIAARRLAPDRAERLREYIATLTRDQQSAVRGLASRLAVLSESHSGPFLQPSSTGPNVNLRETLTGSGVVLFSLNSSTYGGLASLLGTLVVQDVVAASGSRLTSGNTGRPPPPATVAIDEFSALHSDNVLALLARGREARVGVLLCTQELADLDRVGRGFRDEVLGTTAVKLIHRQDVPDSALMAARLAGTVRTWERTYQERAWGAWPAASSGSSAREVQRFRVEPDLISSLGVGEALVISKVPRATAQIARVSPPSPATRSTQTPVASDIGQTPGASAPRWFRTRPGRADGARADSPSPHGRASQPADRPQSDRSRQPPEPGVTR
ncbi:MAG: helicase HerA-like domain-containing protein [Solirubrobacteraceae bacterium]